MNKEITDIMSSLHTSLISAIAETKDVHADSTNPFHRNKYASLGQHLKEIKPIFAKHGLAIVQMPESQDGVAGVRTTVIHKDGGSMTSFFGLPVSPETKGQDAGALVSYIRRYSLASLAGVATEDDDGESDRASRPAQASQSIQNTKFIPNPTAKPAYTGKGGDTKFTVPFGDCKGQALSSLPIKSNDKSKKCGDLYYWAKVWTPKPFGENPEPSPKDLALKAEAIRLFEAGESADVADSQTDTVSDDVPF